MNVRKCTSRPMFVLQTYEDRNANSDLSQKLSERLSNLQKENSKEKCTSPNRNSVPAGPPPPPPLPTIDETPKNHTVSPKNHPAAPKTTTRVQKPQAPPVPEKRSTLSTFHQPPPCPTPDYDTLSISSTMSISKMTNGFAKNHQEQVEMESLESFELYNHYGNRPRPPDIYFSNNATPTNGSISSGTSTLKKQRPVSVTIGEYGNGTIRRQPGKLDFLQNGNGDDVDGGGRRTNNQPITSQLASELAQTLNRSNLRRRTESMANCDK